jgi:phage gp45-like
LNISQRIRNAQPGDQVVFEAKGRPLRSLSSVASGKTNKVLGNAKHRVTQNTANQTVTITVLGRRELSGLDEALAELGILS